jgi:hypothetical protein
MIYDMIFKDQIKLQEVYHRDGACEFLHAESSNYGQDLLSCSTLPTSLSWKCYARQTLLGEGEQEYTKVLPSPLTLLGKGEQENQTCSM